MEGVRHDLSSVTSTAACNATPSHTLDVKQLFPAFTAQPDTIFADNASTTQKPQTVIDSIESFYRTDCANAGRAIYPSSLRAGQAIEKARQDVATFINGQPSEIAFTAGATDSLNAVAWMWGLANLQDGDEVLLCPQDHSSAVLPWQNMQATLARLGKRISIVPFDIHAVGDYDLRSIKRALSDRTRVIALSHIHHVFGLDMEIKEIRELVGANVVITLDASQSIGHTIVDAKSLDVDFISFSGHKMFAGNGVGVLFARAQRQGELIALRTGGQSAAFVSDMSVAARDAFINKVEGGTLNIPSVVSLSAAIQFIQQLGIEKIENHVSSLTSKLVEGVSKIPGVIFAPGPVPCGCPGGFGILSFRFEQASSLDVASALANERIYVRSGLHCRADVDSGDDYIRVSLHVYNTQSDVQVFVETLHGIVA
jgi:cysteine desulfurase / selenocysteine lyase